jgi:hypothetical protein
MGISEMMERRPLPQYNSRLGATLIVGLLAVAIGWAWYTGCFDSVPTQCSDISAWRINDIWKDAPLARLTGIRVLEPLSITDTGSTDQDHLKCDAKVMLSSGAEVIFHVSTKIVNGSHYIQVAPSIFD